MDKAIYVTPPFDTIYDVRVTLEPVIDLIIVIDERDDELKTITSADTCSMTSHATP